MKKKKELKTLPPKRERFNYDKHTTQREGERKSNRRTSHGLANFVYLFIYYWCRLFQVKLGFFMIILACAEI